MKWSPEEVIKLVAMIGALIFFGLGAFMMWKGISAEGAIDIRSSVLSGSIKTASTGLFITFLSFAVIVFVLLSFMKKNEEPKPVQVGLEKKSKRVGKALTLLFVGLVISGSLSAAGFGSGFGALAMAFGFSLIPVGVAYITVLESE